MQSLPTADITGAVYRKNPTNRDELIHALRTSVSSVDLKVVDSHNTASVIFIIQGEEPVLIKGEYGQDTATHREIVWYERQRATGKDYQNLFMTGYRADRYALLFLRYIDSAFTLDELVSSASVDGNGFGELIVKTLSYDRSLFDETSRKVQQSVIGRFLLDKYRARRSRAKCTPYLDELLSMQYVLINGKRYMTPDLAMAGIIDDPDKMRILLPTKVGLIHGDLHTGNVLIKDGELYYIDPNGNLDMPIEYDIGKLLHSVHGKYPLIMQGNFLVEEQRGGGFNFAVRASKIYDEAYSQLCNNLTNDQYLRGLFAEALHFATMLPHHTKNRTETIALYLRATELFNELLVMLK